MPYNYKPVFISSYFSLLIFRNLMFGTCLLPPIQRDTTMTMIVSEFRSILESLDPDTKIYALINNYHPIIGLDPMTDPDVKWDRFTTDMVLSVDNNTHLIPDTNVITAKALLSLITNHDDTLEVLVNAFPFIHDMCYLAEPVLPEETEKFFFFRT
jgi:hypothetical protein